MTTNTEQGMTIVENDGFKDEDYGRIIKSDIKDLKRKENFYKKFCERGSLFQDLGISEDSQKQFMHQYGCTTYRDLSYYLKGLVSDDLNKALEIFSELIDRNISFPFLYNDRGLIFDIIGKIHFNLKNNQQAIEDYTKALEINQNLFEPYFNRGLIFYDQGQLEQAFEEFTRAIEIKQNDDSVYMIRCIIQHRLGHKQLAIAEYTVALQLNPRHDQAQTNRGNIFYRFGQLEKAIEDLKSAIKINPKNHQAYNNLGKTLYEQGKKVEALENYNYDLLLSPKNPFYLSQLGKFYYVENNYNQALYFLQMAQLELNKLSKKEQNLLHLSQENLQSIKRQESKIQMLNQKNLQATRACTIISESVEWEAINDFFLDEVQKGDKFLQFFLEEFQQIINNCVRNVQQIEYINFEMNFNQLRYFKSFYWRTYCYFLACQELQHNISKINNGNIDFSSKNLAQDLQIILEEKNLNSSFISFIFSNFEIISLLFRGQNDKDFTQIQRLSSIAELEGTNMKEEIKFAAKTLTLKIQCNSKHRKTQFPLIIEQIINVEKKIFAQDEDQFWLQGIEDCLNVLTYLEKYTEQILEGQNQQLRNKIIEVVSNSSYSEKLVSVQEPSSSCCIIQ